MIAGRSELTSIKIGVDKTDRVVLNSAMYYFDPQTLIHYTQAARTINAGEEVTITCKLSQSLALYSKLTTLSNPRH